MPKQIAQAFFIFEKNYYYKIYYKIRKLTVF